MSHRGKKKARPHGSRSRKAMPRELNDMTDGEVRGICIAVLALIDRDVTATVGKVRDEIGYDWSTRWTGSALHVLADAGYLDRSPVKKLRRTRGGEKTVQVNAYSPNMTTSRTASEDQ